MRPVSEVVQHQSYEADATDAHGNPAAGWGPAVEVGVFAFDPGSTNEPRNPGADRVIVAPTLYLPADAVFNARDRVTARGELFEVDGETRRWVHPTDATRRANVVSLRRVTG